MLRPLTTLLFLALIASSSPAQFADEFNDSVLKLDATSHHGWAYYTGDGRATMDFRQGDNYAAIQIDATRDQRNIWWALIRREVSGALDMEKLSRPDYELRIEARVKTSHAPRRVNLHVNTPRTARYHDNLMEYDLPDTTNWHRISFTTDSFDVIPSDTIYAQMALMDWGRQKFELKVDYYRVQVVPKNDPGPSYGTAVPYHPPLANPDTFKMHLPAVHDATVDLEYPDTNLNSWSSPSDQANNLLNVSGSRYAILRFDLEEYRRQETASSALLELHTHSLQRSADHTNDFGMIRVVEIMSENTGWTQASVTWNSLSEGHPLHEIINPQTIYDTEVNIEQKESTLITISQPVMQRLLDGRTKGLAILPLGAVSASFYGSEHGEELAPKLHFSY